LGATDPQPTALALATQAWNIMRGIDWAALPIVAEMLGIIDIEELIFHLTLIREQQSHG